MFDSILGFRDFVDNLLNIFFDKWIVSIDGEWVLYEIWIKSSNWGEDIVDRLSKLLLLIGFVGFPQLRNLTQDDAFGQFQRLHVHVLGHYFH